MMSSETALRLLYQSFASWSRRIKIRYTLLPVPIQKEERRIRFPEGYPVQLWCCTGFCPFVGLPNLLQREHQYCLPAICPTFRRRDYRVSLFHEVSDYADSLYR